jgi:hypothetical protein
VNVDVRLTLPEFVCAVNTALWRLGTSEIRGFNHAKTYQRSWLKRLVEETVGACAEIGWSKLTHLYWGAHFDRFHEFPDVDDVEVRGCELDHGRLILRDHEPQDRVYVLFTGQPPLMTLRGYIYGGDIEKVGVRENPNGYGEAWFVAQRHLKPVPADRLKQSKEN